MADWRRLMLGPGPDDQAPPLTAPVPGATGARDLGDGNGSRAAHKRRAEAAVALPADASVDDPNKRPALAAGSASMVTMGPREWSEEQDELDAAAPEQSRLEARAVPDHLREPPSAASSHGMTSVGGGAGMAGRMASAWATSSSSGSSGSSAAGPWMALDAGDVEDSQFDAPAPVIGRLAPRGEGPDDLPAAVLEPYDEVVPAGDASSSSTSTVSGRRRGPVGPATRTLPPRGTGVVLDDEAAVALATKFRTQQAAFDGGLRERARLFVPPGAAARAPASSTDRTSKPAARQVQPDPSWLQIHMEPPRIPGNPRERTVPTDYRFVGDHHIYVVRLIGDDKGWPRSLDPPVWATTLTIESTANRGGRSAVGRAFHGAQHCEIVTTDPAEGQAIVDEIANYPDVTLGRPSEPGWTQLDAPVDQPVRVWVREDDLGAAETRPGMDPGRRRTDLGAIFDRQWAARGGTLATSERTAGPRTGRAGVRDPGALYSSSASALAGSPGRGTGGLADYEFCHLIGDGDGGACAVLNLVVGTNAANTEQLALETTLRRYRGQAERFGWWVKLEVRALHGNPDGQGARRGFAIDYRLSLVPGDKSPDDGKAEERFIISQKIDMDRGVIPVAEVVALQAIVKTRFEAALIGLRSASADQRVPTPGGQVRVGPSAPGGPVPPVRAVPSASLSSLSSSSSTAAPSGAGPLSH